jgi:hypothetical protein
VIKIHKKSAVVLALLVVVLTVLPGCSSHASVGEWTEVYRYFEGFNAVWGSSPSDVFAVGDDGAIVHYNGTTWSPMRSTTSQCLVGVWGSSASDVFAVGNFGVILHYDGSDWSVMKSGTDWMLTDIWGSSSTDVYVVGQVFGRLAGVYIPTTLHYDGEDWIETSHFGSVHNAVWGSSSSDVFFAGEASGFAQYDGADWSWPAYYFSSSEVNFFDIWGSSPSDVFGVGWLGVIAHYDGSEMKPMKSPMHLSLNSRLVGVWGSSHSDVYAVGWGGVNGKKWSSGGVILHYDGKKWSTSSSSAMASAFHGVWGSSSSDVYVVGSQGGWGTILHFAGRQ